MSTRATGKFYEEKACDFLIEKGYEVICRNWACKFGEIDIIVALGELMVFVEVKYRASNQFGEPEHFVGKGKRKKMHKTANEFIALHDIQNKEYRFDIIGITGTEITHFEDVFWT